MFSYEVKWGYGVRSNVQTEFSVKKFDLHISHQIYANHALEVILRPFLKFVHFYPIRAFTRAFRAPCACIASVHCSHCSNRLTTVLWEGQRRGNYRVLAASSSCYSTVTISLVNFGWSRLENQLDLAGHLQYWTTMRKVQDCWWSHWLCYEAFGSLKLITRIVLLFWEIRSIFHKNIFVGKMVIFFIRLFWYFYI